ncbi:putative hit finger domain protein [Erysiphe necator]|uniref:Box C/D snoRNA protein 1 n=1 Tax=Uncinula necator TaxID=52586 RepID=A0A0B1PG15_UNCNE|nr:putative hit finger domain protein [Erysiphe necator]
MDETILTSLCSICYIDPPIYTCPRCYANTCSLNCSKRHKIWSSCNGIRDPTIYKPMSQVATPSGIDHDYNFLHSIENGISRSEKILIEDLGLVSREELKRARNCKDDKSFGNKRQKKFISEFPGEFCINKLTQEKNIQVMRAPKGMRRNKENTTSWNRKRKTIDWQVEWLRKEPTGINRILHKVSGINPIGTQYDSICEEERLMKMTDDERRENKRRKTQEYKNFTAKSMKMAAELTMKAPLVILQDPERMTWNINPSINTTLDLLENEEIASRAAARKYDLYIHRPLTPASYPKVLASIDPEKTLTEILSDRCILEYPTIYVFDKGSSGLPDGYMSEQKFLEITQTLQSNNQPKSLNNTAEDIEKESSKISFDSTESSYESENSDSSSSSNS